MPWRRLFPAKRTGALGRRGRGSCRWLEWRRFRGDSRDLTRGISPAWAITTANVLITLSERRICSTLSSPEPLSLLLAVALVLHGGRHLHRCGRGHRCGHHRGRRRRSRRHRRRRDHRLRRARRLPDQVEATTHARSWPCWTKAFTGADRPSATSLARALPRTACSRPPAEGPPTLSSEPFDQRARLSSPDRGAGSGGEHVAPDVEREALADGSGGRGGLTVSGELADECPGFGRPQIARIDSCRFHLTINFAPPRLGARRGAPHLTSRTSASAARRSVGSRGLSANERLPGRCAHLRGTEIRVLPRITRG